MKCLSSKIVFESKRFNVEEAIYKADNGKTYVRDHVLSPNAVAILPVTKDGKIIFVKEARTAIGNIVSYDLPAGIIENGENPEVAAIRELEEETGYVTNNVQFLQEYYASKGYTNEKIYLYLADMLDEKTSQNLDDGEEIKTYELDYDEVMKMLDNGELNSAPLNISLLRYREIKEGKVKNKSDSTNAYDAFCNIKNELSRDTIRIIRKSEKSIVLNVDMINDFTRTSAMKNPLAVEIIPSVKKLLEHAKKANSNVFNICEAHDKNATEFLYFPEHGIANTDGAKLVDELTDINYTQTFYKNSTNGFHNEKLRQLVAENKDIDVVVFCGVCADICVLQAALSLKTYYNEINRNVEVVIPMECVETYDATYHNRDLFYYMALEFMKQAGIKIVKKVDFEI